MKQGTDQIECYALKKSESVQWIVRLFDFQQEQQRA